MSLSNEDINQIQLLSDTVEIPPELIIQEAAKKLELHNPDTYIHDNAVFLALHKRICKEARTNKEYIENIKEIRLKLGYINKYQTD